MTQAFNLSQLANNLNTSGQLDATDGLTGAVPVANGGTGLTATPTNGQIDIGNGTGFSRTTITAGSGISVTNGSGTITIATSGGGGVTSLNGQTGAITNTSVDAIGSYIWCFNGSSSPYPPSNNTAGAYVNTGSTIAGSTLRYVANVASNNSINHNQGGQSPVPWVAGGTALSGTWRAMAVNGIFSNFDPCNGRAYANWYPSLWVRIS